MYFVSLSLLYCLQIEKSDEETEGFGQMKLKNIKQMDYLTCEYIKRKF